jgi:hypothetical protein
MRRCIQVQQAERLKIESDFQKQAAELEKQAADARLARQQSLEDRIFAATNDTSTLQGALAAQQRDFAKERLDEAKNNNLDLAQLTVAQQAEELALRKSFNDKAIEETKRAEQERLDAINGTAKSVVDYLNGLVSGPSSTLSPTATLSNAQSVYKNQSRTLARRQSSTPRTSSSRSPTIWRRPRVRSMPQGRAIRTSAIRSSIRDWRCRQCSRRPIRWCSRSRMFSPPFRPATPRRHSMPRCTNVIKGSIDAGNATAIANALLVAGKIPTDGLKFADFIDGLGPSHANLLTKVQVDELKLATNATTGGLLTSTQIDNLGLSKESGNVLKVWQELDGNGNGILERQEAVRAATGNVYESADLDQRQRHRDGACRQ